MAGHRIFTTSFASVYPLYVAKAERKGRTKAEVEAIGPYATSHQKAIDQGWEVTQKRAGR